MTTPLDAAARCDLYALLARIFASELDVELYRALLAQDMLGFMDQSLRAQSPAAAVEALGVEFCRLFIGPQPPCAPYASAYLGEALLGGRSRARLETFLQRIGFAYDLAATRIASPDHIAIVLAVLAYLYTDADLAGSVEEFLQVHVLPWVPAYCEQVTAAASLSLYRTAAALTLALLAEESPARAMRP